MNAPEPFLSSSFSGLGVYSVLVVSMFSSGVPLLVILFPSLVDSVELLSSVTEGIGASGRVVVSDFGVVTTVELIAFLLVLFVVGLAELATELGVEVLTGKLVLLVGLIVLAAVVEVVAFVVVIGVVVLTSLAGLVILAKIAEYVVVVELLATVVGLVVLLAAEVMEVLLATVVEIVVLSGVVETVVVPLLVRVAEVVLVELPSVLTVVVTLVWLSIVVVELAGAVEIVILGAVVATVAFSTVVELVVFSKVGDKVVLATVVELVMLAKVDKSVVVLLASATVVETEVLATVVEMVILSAVVDTVTLFVDVGFGLVVFGDIVEVTSVVVFIWIGKGVFKVLFDEAIVDSIPFEVVVLIGRVIVWFVTLEDDPVELSGEIVAGFNVEVSLASEVEVPLTVAFAGFFVVIETLVALVVIGWTVVFR